ncbi:MAG TPA: DUF2461 domain-containing protein [Bryobacteraceae bacterium]|nr:DUF2461 domain-containing protein [Bryobacteraceae bacterium]
MSSRFPGFPAEALKFLRGLKRNNRREWFQPRKYLYEQHVKAPMLELVAALNAGLLQFAPDYVTDPKKAVFRIYRDTRFSADKTPYKTHIAASFSRRGHGLMASGGFYFSISPEQIEVAGGIYHPPPETTLLVRNHIAENHQALRRILAARNTRKLMGELQGDQLRRPPKGFDADHPAIAWIKMKDWILDVTLDPSLAGSPTVQSEILQRFRVMAPLIEFLNAPLITRRTPAKLLEYGL